MKGRRLAIATVAFAAALLGAVTRAMWLDQGAEGLPSFLGRAERVSAGRAKSYWHGLTASEQVFNIEVSAAEIVGQIRRAYPNAIERRMGTDICLSVPQMSGTRVKVSEPPVRTFVVGSGRLIRKGTRILLDGKRSTDWTHVQVHDLRRESVLETAIHWIKQRFGA